MSARRRHIWTGDPIDSFDEPIGGFLAGSQIRGVCPSCESSEFYTENELDAEGVPTGVFLVTCATCGREIGRLAPREPSAEAEPEPETESLLPGPSEEPITWAEGRWPRS